MPDASLLNDEEKGAESNGSLWRRRTDLALLRPIVGIGDLGDFGEVFPSLSAESNVLCVGVIRMVASKDTPHACTSTSFFDGPLGSVLDPQRGDSAASGDPGRGASSDATDQSEILVIYCRRPVDIIMTAHCVT